MEIVAAVVLLSALSQTQTPSARSVASLSPDDSFALLRSKIDVERVADLTTKAIAGQFSSSPEELRKRVVPFGGDDLYLLPDGSYIHLFSSDIPPPTIRDKGHWRLAEGEVRLTSDSDVTWSPGTERRYLLVRRRSHQQEILAIGIDHDISYFENHANRDPEFQLLIDSKMQVTRITPKDSAKLKQKLMRDAWRPDFYTREEGRHPKK